MEHEILLSRIRELCHTLAPLPTGEQPVFSRGTDPVRAVLFDFYGTLFVSASGDIDPESEQPAALREALESAGICLHDSSAAGACLADYSAAILKTRAGLQRAGIEYPEVDIRMIWSRLVKAWVADGRCMGSCEPAFVDRIAVEYECRVNPVWPMPGLLDVLRELAAKDIKIGLVSNAQFYTPLMFEALAGRSLAAAGFNPKLMVYSFEEREAKPSRRLFEKVARACRDEYAIGPEQILYVGNDMLKDILPAQSLGMKTILFAGDQRSLRRRAEDPRCRGITPDGVVTDLAQIAEWFNRL
ncbi:MAG: HAD family hydrolase [Lentisphaerota bacterium]